jgi:hypothetical protein
VVFSIETHTTKLQKRRRTMRKMISMVVISVVMLAASFAVADVNVSNDIANNNSQTVNTNAAANSAANGGNVDFRNSNVTPIQPYNPTALAPIQTGAALTIGEWGLFLPVFFSEVTMEQSVSLSSEYYGFFTANRIGNEAIMTRNLAPSTSIAITKYWGKMGNDQYIASFPIFGKKGDQLEGLLGLATKRAMELGANKVGIMIRVIKEINTKGLSMGTGAGVGLYVPCNGGVGTGVSLGAYISNTKTEDMYELNVICLRGGAYEPPVVSRNPPVNPIAPPSAVQPPTCNPSEILMRIRIELEAVNYCPNPCLNNEMHRKQLADAYVALYNCTGDKKHLKEAVKQYAIAERDFQNGWEPKKTKSGGKTWTRTLKGAQDIVYRARYNWTYCIYILDGYDAAISFAAKKGLSSAPERFEELR